MTKTMVQIMLNSDKRFSSYSLLGDEVRDESMFVTQIVWRKLACKLKISKCYASPKQKYAPPLTIHHGSI